MMAKMLFRLIRKNVVRTYRAKPSNGGKMPWGSQLPASLNQSGQLGPSVPVPGNSVTITVQQIAEINKAAGRMNLPVATLF